MENQDERWQGLVPEARAALRQRDYRVGSLGEQLAGEGVEVSRLLGTERGDFWIPGVEIFARTIYPQRHRGSFGEFVRRDEGLLARLGLWPQQWAAARMFAQTAKGFHVHPPHVPLGVAPDEWFEQLFGKGAEDFSRRPYAEEQWDVMFFVQGRVEMILREARAGLPRRTMRFFIDGDNHRGPNNAAVVIPPGVAHALRVEGSEDAIMVYGTSTSFQAEAEGRIASEVETAQLPESWQRFLE